MPQQRAEARHAHPDRARLYWLNSLNTPAALLLNDVSELCSGTPQAAATLVDVVLEVVNMDVDGGAHIALEGDAAAASTDRLRAALRLLGQRVGWGNLAPGLFDHSAAEKICHGDGGLLRVLLDDLRGIALRQNSGGSVSAATKSLRRPPGVPPPAPAADIGNGTRALSAPPPGANTPKESSLKSLGAGELGELSNNELELARTRVARMLAEAERSLEQQEEKVHAEVDNPKVATARDDISTISFNDSRASTTEPFSKNAQRSRSNVSVISRSVKQQQSQAATRQSSSSSSSRGSSLRRSSLKAKQRPWVPPSDGWNQSTAGAGAAGVPTSADVGRHAPSIAQKTTRQPSRSSSSTTATAAHRVGRDRRGKHRPAAKSFHNREFQQGDSRVDKDGLFTQGMWDPTFAPSLRRLSQLGFSPSRRRRGQPSHGRGQAGTPAEDHSNQRASSSVSGHASSTDCRDDDNFFGQEGKYHSQMYVPRNERRPSSFKSGMETWKKELRTPGRKQSRARRKGASLSPNGIYSGDAGYLNDQDAAVAAGEGDVRVGEKNPLFKGPQNHSHALSRKQTALLHWMRQLGVKPLPHKKEKELTGSLVSSAFADGVLLCHLVAALEVRAGGRASVVTPTVDGALTLQGTNINAKTTAACTGNINTALKVLRHRKNMNTRHLWAAKTLRNGDAATVWELLSDIEHEYSANHVMQTKRLAKKNKKKVVTAARRDGKKISSQRLKKGTSNTGPRTPGRDSLLGSAANPGSTLRRSVSARGKSRGSSSSIGLLSAGMHRNQADMTQQKPFGLLDPTPAEGLNGSEHNPYSMTSSSASFVSSGSPGRASLEDFKSPLGRSRRKAKRSRLEYRDANPTDVMIGPAVLVFPKSQRRRRRGNTAQGKLRDSFEKTSFTSGAFVFQDVSTLQEEALRKWLQRMGFDVPSPGSSVTSSVAVTEDPLRNGTLLVALVQMLDPDHGRSVLSRVQRNPISTRQAITNVECALRVLRSRRYSAIPAPYLHQPEAIVKGQRAILWGLLWHLKRTIDTFVPDPSEFHQIAGRTPGGKAILRQSSKGGGRNGRPGGTSKSSNGSKKRRVTFFDQTSSGRASTAGGDVSSNMEGSTFREFYTPQESWQLERSLLSWLFSVGVFTKCYPPFDAGVPHDLSDIEAALRNGTLLCAATEEITGKKVLGWMKRPKTDAVARKNIEKALKLLRVTDGMSQRFTWKGDEMHKGSRHDILGIFEDMHRFQDGLVPRPKFLHNATATGVVGGGVFDATPYFGSHVPNSDDMELPEANFSYPGFNTPSSYLIGRTLAKRRAQDLTKTATLNDPIGQALHSSRASTDARIDKDLIFQSSSSYTTRQDVSLENSRGISVADGNMMGAAVDPQSQAQAMSAVAASRTIPLVPFGVKGNQQRGSQSSLQMQESFFSNGGLLVPGENFRAASSPTGKSALRVVNSPSLNNLHHGSASTTTAHAEGGSSSNVDIYPSYSSYRIPDSNPRIGTSSMDISAVSASYSPSITQDPSRQQQGSSSHIAQAVLQNLSLRQRDASNDIVPLPGSLDMPAGHDVLSSVHPEHSPQTVMEANARHGDIMRSLRKMRGAARDRFGATGLTGAGNSTNTLVKWIKERLGLSLERPRDLDANIVPEFSNGVKLCQIVQRCMLMRGAIPGVNSEPKNKAQCLQNIRAALEMLGDKASMPVEHLFSEEQILKGKTSVIVPLLFQIRKAFGHHLGKRSSGGSPQRP